MVLDGSDYKVMKSLRKIVKDRAGVKPGEQVVIIADRAQDQRTLDALSAVIGEAGGIVTIVIQPNAGWNENDPTALTRVSAAAYEHADVVVFATLSSSSSLYSNQVRGPETPFGKLQKALKVRAMFLEDRPFSQIPYWDVDMTEAYNKTTKVWEHVMAAHEVRITSINGTDISAKVGDYIKDPLGKVPYGFKPGAGGTLGAEVHFVPNQNTAEGIFIADGPCHLIAGMWPHFKDPDKPIKWTVKKGKITDVEGGRDAEKFTALMKKIKNLDNVCEFAVGTDPHWINDGSLHMVKKGLGNCHIAFGGWGVLGATVNEGIDCLLHVDVTCYHGTFWADGKKLVDDGKFLV